jgi:DNA-binding IclR family transcriptional regulator
MTKDLIEKEFANLDVGGRREWYQVDRETFGRELDSTRKNGYAVTVDMPVPGITAVSAPVFDHTGRVQLCIAAIGPKPLIDIGPEGAVIPELLAFCQDLSHDLGYLH